MKDFLGKATSIFTANNATLTAKASASWTFFDTCTSTTENTTVTGYSKANKTPITLPVSGNFELIGKISNMQLQNDDGELTVIGIVADCDYEAGTTGGNFKQWHHTLDTEQVLDADSHGDDDMKLPKPSIDNALELQTGD